MLRELLPAGISTALMSMRTADLHDSVDTHTKGDLSPQKYALSGTDRDLV